MRRFLTILVTVMLMPGVQCQALAWNDVSISLKPSVRVTTRTIYLQDIVSFSNANASQSEKLSKIIVAPAPRAGYQTRIEQSEIKRLIQRNSRQLGMSVKVKGANEVVISLDTREIKTEDYLQAAESALYQKLVNHYTNVELSVVGLYKPLHVPLGTGKLKTVVMDDTGIAKRMSVAIEIYQGNNLYLRIPVWFSVKARAVVYAFKNSMPPGTIISEGMLAAKLVAVSDLPQGAITDRYEIIGKQVLDFIHKDFVICANKIHAPFDVVAGQTVTIQVNQGPIFLQTSAIAVESGNRGKRIKLRNTMSNEVFEGKIINKNLVESI